MENKQYVGFWDRFHAVIVTGVLLSIVEMLFSYIAYDDFWMNSYDFFSFKSLSTEILGLVVTVYFWNRYMSDPGKMLFKATIVDATTYEKATLKQYIIRYLGYFLSLIPLGLGFWWVIWDKKKQAWHDKLAHTIVIKPKSEEEKPPWYIQIYRVIVSILFILVMVGFIMSLVIPENTPLIKSENIDQEKLTFLLKNNYIKDKSDLLYYTESNNVFKNIQNITLIGKSNICEIDSDSIKRDCYAYKDINKLEIVYEDYDDFTYVLLYDALLYAEVYYDDNLTYKGLYSEVVLNINEKDEFNTTVMGLWESAKTKEGNTQEKEKK